MTIEKQVSEITRVIEEFASCIDSLPNKLFSKRIENWAPRDILAHLIGWNRYTIAGSKQIMEGKTPFYFKDPGDDFCKVNAVLIEEYSSHNRDKLLSELQKSFKELKHFLLSLDTDDWSRDYGVRYKGEPVTIQNSVDVLIDDYIYHRKKIKAWTKGKA